MSSLPPSRGEENLAELLEALRASEEFKTRVIEHSRDCIKVLDLDGNLLSMNAGGMEALEICDLGPLLHNSWIEFWEGDDREAARAAVAAARRGEVGRFVGNFHTLETHRSLWFHVVVSAIRDRDGKPERLLALSRDISDVKRAEIALRESHAELEMRVQERTAEIARVNVELAREAAERRLAETTLRAIVEGVEAETGDRFFESLARHLAGALGVQYAFVSELSADRKRFRALAVWGRGQQLDNFEAPLDGTPCETVLHGAVSHHPCGLQEAFPADIGLVDWGVVSYCGVPLIDPGGSVLGHLAILDDKPMPDGDRATAIMRIFAARACAESERLRYERALRDSEERLSQVLASAMDAIVTVDESGTIVLFNDAAAKVFRCLATDAIGSLLGRFLTEKLERALRASMARLDAGDASQPWVWAPDGLSARAADGHEFPIEATFSRAHARGRTLYTLILRSTEERTKSEAQLRTLNLQNEYLQEEIRTVHNVDAIVGQSPAFRDAFDKVALVGPTDSRVLILGETGTGKEVIARAIHSASRRGDRPLIKVNCAALPAGLIESELFGHEKGAFTGASERRIGRFELADGGTLLLDEVGEIPLDVQVKLLRTLQEREIERVGGNQAIKVDVRVIAATNRDLLAAIAAGTFRQDLFYRLHVFPIVLPPLRARPDDIPLLVHYFVRRFAAKIGRRILSVAPTTMARLATYRWPGNVRELENVIERAVILSRGPELEVDPGNLVGAADPGVSEANSAPVSGTLEEVERRHIVAVLRQTDWRIEGPSGAAVLLGINASTLRSRIKKLGILRSIEATS